MTAPVREVREPVAAAGRPSLPPLALPSVTGATIALAVALTVSSERYGYHRDELYFRMLRPAWGYVDQPPLAPLLARAAVRLLGDQPWALRIPATAACVLSVGVLVLVVRELGGGRGAQALCAWGYSFASFTLIEGHVLLTSTLDMPAWPALVLFVIRSQMRRDLRWLLAAGAVAGLSTYNKFLVTVLVVALAVGALAVGKRTSLLSRWTAAGALLALLLALPNVLYQATHGWPQLSMGRALAEQNAGQVRVMELPFLLLMLGPPLVPVWVAGLVALWQRPAWRPVRFLVVAFPVLLAVVFAMGAQFYYPFGLLVVLFAAGCVPTAEWAAHRRVRVGLLVAGVALNAAVSVVIGLPVVPTGALGATPIPGINQVARDSVGWPAYTAQIAAVWRTVPVGERARAVVLTSNYGEAGAVARYGPALGLRRVYSGHNALWYRGPPPDDADIVVFVGGQGRTAFTSFESCVLATRLDDEAGVDNEEQDEPVYLCRRPVGGWSRVWPALRHEG